MRRIFLVAALLAALPFAAGDTHAAGALVVGSCGAYGEAHDFGNSPAARASALSKCQGPGCRLVVTLKGDCAAFAVDAVNPCGASAWASGGHLGRAQNDALRKCFKDGGRECVIRTFVCDGRG